MFRDHFETQPSLRVPNWWRWSSHWCSPAVKDSTTHPVGTDVPSKQEQNCRNTHGSKHETFLLGREFSPGPPWPQVTMWGRGGEGSEPLAVLRSPGAPPGPQGPHPAPVPFLSPAAGNEGVFQVSQSCLPCWRHACSKPSAAWVVGNLVPAVQGGEEGSSRPGGSRPGGLGWSEHQQERSGENEPQSLPFPEFSI